MFFSVKKKARLCSLIALTLLAGQIVCGGQTALAAGAEILDGVGYNSASSGISGVVGDVGKQLASGTSEFVGKGISTGAASATSGGILPKSVNWNQTAGVITSMLGGMPVQGSSTAKSQFTGLGCEAIPIPVCKLSPGDVEVNQNYTAQCVFTPIAGVWAVPAISKASGNATEGQNTATMKVGLMHIGWSHGHPFVELCGAEEASVSFMAYEGAGSLGGLDTDFGGVTGLEGLDQTGTTDTGSFDFSDTCIFGNCSTTPDTDFGEDSYNIGGDANNAFSETGSNSWNAPDADWMSSSGGSEGSSDLGDYFGDSGDQFDSGSAFGTLDDGMGDSYLNGTDTNGDGLADAWDTNGDGTSNAFDTDGDGIADAWDTNGDGIIDAWDTNGDGRPDAWDTDGDGIPDAWDTDGDGIPDAWDTDGDGIPDKFAGDGEYSGEDVNAFDNGIFGDLYKNLFGGDASGNSLLGNISNFLGGLSSSFFGGEAKTASDAEMYGVSRNLLKELGYSDEDIRNGKNYDSGSAYTDPQKAWDMNRITTLLSKHRLNLEKDGDIEKPTKDDMKKSPRKNSYTKSQGGVFMTAAKDYAKNADEQGQDGQSTEAQQAQQQAQQEKTPEQQAQEAEQVKKMLRDAGVPEDEEGKKQYARQTIEALSPEERQETLANMPDEAKEALGLK